MSVELTVQAIRLQIARVAGHAAIGIMDAALARMYAENLTHALNLPMSFADDELAHEFIMVFMLAYEGKETS